MRIFFGSRHFKIRDLYPHELRLLNNTDLNIEIRQKYFHIYWIPLFGLGKIWLIRKDDQLYELPIQYIQEIKRQNIKVRSPWYTYAGPLLICLGFFLYTINQKVKENRYDDQQQKSFIENAQLLNHQIDKAGVTEFFTIEDPSESSSQSIDYLKVEKVYKDKIKFSLIPGFFLESSQLELEECYNQNKNNLDTITISKAELKNAINTNYELSNSHKFKGITLLNSNKPYALTKIEQKFEPRLDITKTYNDYKIIQIELTNKSSAFKIVSIKNITNKIPWSTKLPFEVAAGTDSKPSSFLLESADDPKFSFYGNKKYAAEIKIIDSNAIEHTFFLSGEGSANSISKSKS